MNNPDEILFDAARYGDEAQVQAALNAGARRYNDAMEHAAAEGHAAIVEMLMPHADEHNNAMVVAADKGYTDIVRMLASHVEQPLSWLGDHAIKEARLEVARAHHAADTLRQGKYYDDGNVCAISCSVPPDVAKQGVNSIREYDSQHSGLGYAWLWVQELLFEADRRKGGDPQAAADFALASLETMPIGIDTNQRAADYLEWQQQNPDASLDERRETFLSL